MILEEQVDSISFLDVLFLFFYNEYFTKYITFISWPSHLFSEETEFRNKEKVKMIFLLFYKRDLTHGKS